MQQPYQCPNCGYPVAFGARFCGNCGTPLTWQQQTPPPPVYQQPGNSQQQQGKPIGVEIWVKNSIPYPNEKNRWPLYGNPLSSVFKPYFELVYVEYGEIEGRLHHFIVRAFNPLFVINQQNEDEFYDRFFIQLCNEVINLFFSMNISVQIYDIWRSYQSHEDYIKEFTMKKMGKFPQIEMKSSDIEMTDKDMRVTRFEDGRYCLAFTNKKDGRRCYTDIPEELAGKVMGEQHKV